MSALVPTRRSSVEVPCPGWDGDTECRASLDVTYYTSGRHIKATHWTPEEWPEVYLDYIPARCEACGTMFDEFDTLRICGAAEREVAREFV